MMSLASSVFGVGTAPEDTIKKKINISEMVSDTEASEEEDDLESRFPTLSKEECDRFRGVFPEDECLKKLEECVRFRAMYELDSPEAAKASEENDDQADWEWAAKTAIEAAKKHEELIPGLEEGCVAPKDRVCTLDRLPQNCHCHKNEDGSPVETKQGHRSIQFMSAMLDLVAVSPEIHAVCLALYLERKSRAIDFSKGAVLLVDTRQGNGWPNHNVLTVVGYIRMMFSVLHSFHPGRLEKVIIYPVPYACAYVFGMIKVWLPTSIAENVILADSSDGADDPPKEELNKYVEDNVLAKLEATRQSFYQH